MSALMRTHRRPVRLISLLLSAVVLGGGVRAAQPQPQTLERLEASITAAEGVRAVKRLQQ